MLPSPSARTTRRGHSMSNTNRMFLTMVSLLALVFTIFNVVVIHQESPSSTKTSSSSSSVETPSSRSLKNNGFAHVSSRRGLRETNPQSSSPRHASRTFVGIFSRDDEMGAKQRHHYRAMFEDIWNHDRRVCSLPQFQQRVHSVDANPATRLRPDDCLLIYTFVVGAHKPNDTNAPAEIVEDSVAKLNERKGQAWLVVDQIVNPYSKDVNQRDVTRLNIRENDHDGKSQTFLYFAYRDVMGNGENHENPIIEYCMKIAPDTFLSLEQFFDFSETNLAPAPFHRGVLAGGLRDKSYWMSSDDEDDGDNKRSDTQENKPEAPLPEDMPRLESFWGNEFEGIHLYTSGQLYILSYDLVEFVLTEVPYSRVRVGPGGYLIGREAHDISSMAFHSPTPLQVIAISKSQRFWKHPLKSDDHWKLLVAEEQQRKTKR